MGPMLAPWTLLSGNTYFKNTLYLAWCIKWVMMRISPSQACERIVYKKDVIDHVKENPITVAMLKPYTWHCHTWGPLQWRVIVFLWDRGRSGGNGGHGVFPSWSIKYQGIYIACVMTLRFEQNVRHFADEILNAFYRYCIKVILFWLKLHWS